MVGPPGSPFIARARELSQECKLWRGRESEQGYAFRVAGLPRSPDIYAPLRAPHHTVTRQAIEGDLRGHQWRPGEAHLAHGGVLYLQDLNEFRSDVLEAVAAVWKAGKTSYSSQRLRGLESDQPKPDERNLLTVPAVFTLVMATGPCPCGYRGVEGKSCACQDRQIEHYHARVALLTADAEREEHRAVTP